MPPTAGIWTETFRVRSYETDPHGFAPIRTLCNYFQEAAGNHALQYGVSIEQLMAEDLTWVLSRLHVEIDAYPRRGDAVRIETWPCGVEGLLAHRDFLIYRAASPDETQWQRLGRGASAWLVVDVGRKRPVRVPEAITGIVPPRRPRAFPEAFEPPTPPARVDRECRFRVRYGDLDVNRHVNNVRYTDWVVETVPDDVLQGGRLLTLTLQFRAETTFGDTIVGQACNGRSEDVRTFDHRLLREADGREVALARTRWAIG